MWVIIRTRLINTYIHIYIHIYKYANIYSDTHDMSPHMCIYDTIWSSCFAKTVSLMQRMQIRSARWVLVSWIVFLPAFHERCDLDPLIGGPAPSPVLVDSPPQTAPWGCPQCPPTHIPGRPAKEQSENHWKRVVASRLEEVSDISRWKGFLFPSPSFK